MKIKTSMASRQASSSYPNLLTYNFLQNQTQCPFSSFYANFEVVVIFQSPFLGFRPKLPLTQSLNTTDCTYPTTSYLLVLITSKVFRYENQHRLVTFTRSEPDVLQGQAVQIWCRIIFLTNCAISNSIQITFSASLLHD